MGNLIQSIPLNNDGDLLFIRKPELEGDRIFIEYKTLLNDIPFRRVELFASPEDKTYVILGGNGTVLYRIGLYFIYKLLFSEGIITDDEQGDEVSE